MEMRAEERFRALIARQEIDRLPAIEWAPWWDKTTARWKEEGVFADSVLALQKQFGLDGCFQYSVPTRTAATPLPRFFGSGVMADEQGYERIRPTLFPDPAPYFNPDTIAELKRIREKEDSLLFFTVEGFFWYPRELFGIENHLYSFYDEPDLLKRMCDDYLAWLRRVFEVVGNSFRFDFMSFAEDMSYNNGPMLGKDTFDEFLAPYYRQIIPVIKNCGIPVFIDSDGDITMAVDWYAGVGADGMFPLERQAGVDVSLYLEKQPGMTFLGHFDKMCMKFGREAMEREFERLLPSMKTRRFIASVDHQTPPDVSVENYREYVKLLRHYTEIAVK